MLALYGLITFSRNAVLTPLLGVLWGSTLFAEVVILPACLFAFFRYPHVRSWTQAGGLLLIAAHLFLIFAAPFSGAGI